MYKRKIIASGIIMMLGAPLSAFAAESVEMRQIRNEINALKQSYEARIQALEQRLQKTEVAASAAESHAAQAETIASQAAAVPAPQSSASPADNANAFNPGVSLILSGIYSNLSQDPAGHRITGFHLPGEVLGEITPQRGFGLAESELGIYANIDPYFRGGLNFSIAPDNTVAAEEAFIQTTGAAAMASPSRPAASSPASATSTSSMPTPGISSMRRWPTRLFSAAR